MIRQFSVLVDQVCTSTLARAGVLGLVYFAGAELGHVLSLKTQDQTFATFWPPAGLLLAALVLTPRRSWPAMVLAACGANLASDVLLHDKPVPVSLGFCAANCAEACLGAWLLHRFVVMPFTLARVQDVVSLAWLSALVSTLLGATIGAAVVNLAFYAPYWSAWRVWWSADAIGVLVVAPVVFAWAAHRNTSFQAIRPWRIVEGVGLFFGLVLTAEGVFGEWLPRPLTLPMLVLPFLLWAGLRFSSPVAASATLIVVVIAIWNTVQGRGHYTILTAVPSEQIVKAQVALCVMSLSMLTLAAVVAERKQAERQRVKLIHELEQALAEVKTLRGLIPICASCKKIRDDQGFWKRLEVYLLAHTEATQFTHGLCPECLDEQLATLEHGS